MHAFWRWLMKANARLIFLCAVIALCVVIIFWLWKLHIPIQTPTFQPSASAARRPLSSLGILAMLDNLAGCIAEPPQNFFLAPEPPRPRLPQIPMPPPSQQTQSPPVQQPAQQPQQQPPPQPKRNIVSLVYRGMFKTPDGRSLALIEDVTAGKQAFYSVSNQIHGITIVGFDQTNASLTFADGTPGAMVLRSPLNIEGGHRAE